MFELLSLIAIVLAIVGLSTARGVRNRLESELAALKLEIKRLEGLRMAGDAAEPAGGQAAAEPGSIESASTENVPEAQPEVLAAEAVSEPSGEPVVEPAAALEAAEEKDSWSDPTAQQASI